MRVLTFLFLVVLFLGFSSCKENQQSKKEEVKIEFSNYIGELSFGTIKRIDSFPTKFVRSRIVDVWLPENYSENELMKLIKIINFSWLGPKSKLAILGGIMINCDGKGNDRF